MIEFDNYLSPGRRGHLVGIGGVSMSSLAEVLSGMGITVTGSDMNEGQNVESLRAHGFPVSIGHRAENIDEDVDFLVRTAAAHEIGVIAAGLQRDEHLFDIFGWRDIGHVRPRFPFDNTCINASAVL